MKKTFKPTKTPAPAKKSKPAAAKAPVAPAAPVVKTAAPAIRKTALKAVTTLITAHLDVGFGNALYLRGEGPGLSWEKGLVMDCVADDRWSIALPESGRPVVFKFLLNDETWCTGEDYVAKPGLSLVFTPLF